jgi:predicted N-acetyltransferase YhbS
MLEVEKIREHGKGGSLRSFQADIIDQPEALQQWEELLNACFGVPQGRRYLEDFPVWDRQWQSGSLIRLGAFQKDQLVASVSVRLAKLRVQDLQGSNQVVSIACVGAVATYPAFRGYGLASELLSLGIQWAEERSASHILLWSSGLSRLYSRLGFELLGTQVRIPLQKIRFPQVASYEIHQGWNPALFDVLKKRSDGLVLESCDEAWYSAHRHVRWYWVGPEKAPLAYLAYERGIDLKQAVHEWGGDPQGLLSLLVALKAECPEAFLLGASEHEAVFQDWGCEVGACETEPVAWVKSLHGSLQNFWIWGLDAT